LTYQNLKEILVGDVGQLGAVELGDDELCDSKLASFSRYSNPISIHSMSARKPGSTTCFKMTCDRCGEGYAKGRGITYRMATAERLDVEESKDLVTLEDLEGRDITYIAKRVLAIQHNQVHPKDRSFGNSEYASSELPTLDNLAENARGGGGHCVDLLIVSVKQGIREIEWRSVACRRRIKSRSSTNWKS
jgi:hypothetical protein